MMQTLDCPGMPNYTCYNVSEYCLPGAKIEAYKNFASSKGNLFENYAQDAYAFEEYAKDEIKPINGRCPVFQRKESMEVTDVMKIIDTMKTCPGYEDLLCTETAEKEKLPSDWLWFCVAVVLLFVFMICVQLANRRYGRKQAAYEVKTELKKTVELYEKDLVKNLVPRLTMPSYQFQGVRPIPKNKNISLQFEELSLTLHSNKKCVLAGVTGEINACTMSALMGPSGAGKTTFLNVLCGKAYYGETGGTVLINGKKGDVSSLKKVMGFVPQDDVVFEALTVREQIYYSAQLRNPTGTTNARIKRIVEDVLAIMQIRHIQNSIVGGVEERGISGGQRKRVNIGLELAACPILLFLDEPTSGLDATSSLEILASLKCMAKMGMTIIMVIHQPRFSLFQLFDNVILLGVGGHTVYQGPASGAQPYFESLGYELPKNDNPADWFMDVISGHVDNKRNPKQTSEQLFGLWNENKEAVASKNEALNTDTVSIDGDDAAITRMIAQALESEWWQFDTDENGTLSSDEFHALLTKVADKAPSDDVFDALWETIAGDDDYIQKQEFVYFFKRRAHEIDKDALPSSEESDAGSDDDGMNPQKPSCISQFYIILKRAVIIYSRKAHMRYMNYGLVAFAAVVISYMTRPLEPWNPAVSLGIYTAQITLSLLIAVAALGVFGYDRPIIWREAASGTNRLALYLARILIDTFSVLVSTMLFVVIWSWTVDARGLLEFQFFIPMLLLSLTSAAIGYATSTIVPPRNATLTVCIIVMILGAVLAQPNQIAGATGSAKMWMYRCSYISFSVGLTYLSVVKTNGGEAILAPGTQGIFEGYEDLTTLGGNADYYMLSSLALVCNWIILLIVGYFGLKYVNRGKQI